LNKHQVWIASFLAFLVFRFFNETLFTEGALIGLILLGMALYWCLVPIIFKSDMLLPGIPSIVFKHGIDNPVRVLSLLIGIFMCFAAFKA